jgi:hypothetical protein
MSLEDAVDDPRGERLGGRSRNGHVVDGAEVLVAAVEVLDVRAAVLEVHRVEQLAAAAHVEDHRDAGLLRLPPHGVERDVAGGVVVRAAARHQQGGGAHRDRLAGHGRRPLEVGQRHVAGGQQPVVDRAELHHAAVVGAGGAVGEVEVAGPLEAQQVTVVEGVEHELAGHPDEVEGQRPVGGDGAAGGLEVLALHDLLGVALPELGVAVALEHLLDRLGLARPEAELHVGPELLPHVGVGVVDQPRGRLHDVGVGVVHHSPLDVRHLVPLR